MSHSIDATVSHMPSVAAERRLLGPDFVPGPYDVMCQRGGAAKKHAGNQRYRNIVNDKLADYTNAKTKFEKSLIVSGIIDAVRDYSPNGGFVKKLDGNWYEVGDAVSREKTGQVIRDCLHTSYKSSTKSKSGRRKELKELKKQRKGHQQQQRVAQPTGILKRGSALAPVDNNVRSSFRSSYQLPQVHEVDMSLTSLLRMSSSAGPGQKRPSSVFLKRPSARLSKLFAEDNIRSSFQILEDADSDVAFPQLLRMSSTSVQTIKRCSSLFMKRPSVGRRSTIIFADMIRSSFAIGEDFEADVSLPDFLQMISEEQQKRTSHCKDFDTVMNARNSLVENNFYLDGTVDLSLPNLLRYASTSLPTQPARGNDC